MASRFWPRLMVMAKALPRLLRRAAGRPKAPRRILIAHHLLLGDTIMMAPLLKKLRLKYPGAQIDMLCPRPFVGLFAGTPWGVRALPYDRRSVAAHRALLGGPGYDLALVPGDNRYAWIARAMGARWIVAFAGDSPAYKNWPIDELVPMPDQPAAWGDIAARLADGEFDAPFEPGEWPAPPAPDFPRPAGRYCVLHLGASSPHKLWPPENWRRLAEWAEQRGWQVVLSAGEKERELARAVDPEGRRLDLSGRLDLAALWHLLAGADFVVCPDTGVAHLARLTSTPTVALFGPGSPTVSGAGRFWRHSPFCALTVPVPCRDQARLFHRDVAWVRHCLRSPAECSDPVCMKQLSVEAVIERLLETVAPGRATDSSDPRPS